jgi:hypothetical protein
VFVLDFINNLFFVCINGEVYGEPFDSVGVAKVNRGGRILAKHFIYTKKILFLSSLKIKQ